jgi:hypothetical protein
MKKALIAILLFLVGGLGGYLLAQKQVSPLGFSQLSPKQKYQRVIEERDEAIAEAVERGVFRCCIDPPCTMCYMEANQWNNFQAGTCACDDLIAQGKEPCPQCIRGLCTSEEGTCGIGGE